jgi:Predicted unsaturated glucuronyl hydrolase involved in regulation of bacterial surface properties, and related proteins
VGYYFSKEESIIEDLHKEANVEQVISRIANRFMEDNPPTPVTFHTISKKNFKATFDYMDEIKLHEIYPNMKLEDYAYAWTMLNATAEGAFTFRMKFFGPVFVYLNGELAARSSLYQERFPEAVENITLNLKKGENSLVFLCIKTPLGCGFSIGSNSYKGRRIQFFAPTKERKGMGGFIFSAPMSEPLSKIPQLYEAEETTRTIWYPEIKWSFNQLEETPIERIFGKSKGKFVALVKLCVPKSGICNMQGNFEKISAFYINGKEVKCESKKEWKLELVAGEHTILVIGASPVIELQRNDELTLKPIVTIEGYNSSPWIYGEIEEHDFDGEKMAKEFTENPQMAMRMLLSNKEKKDYWYVDMPACRIRPYNEGTNYGEWSYPLGVTLYGLLQTGRLLENQEILSYITGHMEKTTEYFEYCMWDKSEYGAASFHNQLTTIESLDDCGSFGSAMLEWSKDWESEAQTRIAKYIGEYIKEKQYRLEDGLFYRDHGYLKIMDKTVWADDMYMSIPFLCRYYQFSKEESYLEDAVNQVILFNQYLYMPEQQIFSHIYDVHYNLQTKVPWGRGNGWAAFSITELLAVLPMSHSKYNQIKEIFNCICQGYLSLQGKTGMWHQVLTMESSYQETSCTAMFLYAFSRGLRYGWLPLEGYYEAAVKAWNGLCTEAVDKEGNIYGVCRGSGYSFSKEYYANDLSWNYNDTHGTGIVMLAGMEFLKMKEGLKK